MVITLCDIFLFLCICICSNRCEEHFFKKYKIKSFKELFKYVQINSPILRLVSGRVDKRALASAGLELDSDPTASQAGYSERGMRGSGRERNQSLMMAAAMIGSVT